MQVGQWCKANSEQGGNVGVSENIRAKVLCCFISQQEKLKLHPQGCTEFELVGHIVAYCFFHGKYKETVSPDSFSFRPLLSKPSRYHSYFYFKIVFNGR